MDGFPLKNAGVRNDLVATEGWHWRVVSTEMPYRGSKATRPGPVDPLSWREFEQPAGGVKVVVRGSHEVTVPSNVCGAIVVGGIRAQRDCRSRP
jgi:hypothetical protein